MKIEQYTEADLEQVKRLHAGYGFDAKLPTLSREAFFSRRVIKDGDTVRMAAFMRHAAEAFVVCDPEWRGPAWRLEALRQLTQQGNSDARDAGVKVVYAFISHNSPRFTKRLATIGWAPEDFQCVSHEVI